MSGKIILLIHKALLTLLTLLQMIVPAHSCIIITCWQSLLLSFIMKLEIFYFYDDTQIDDLKIMELILTDLNVNSVSKVSGYSTLNINPTERVYNKS